MAMSLLQAELLYAFPVFLCNLTLALKLFTRIKYIGGLQIDDYLILIAYIFLSADVGLTYVMFQNGLREPEAAYIFLGFGKIERLLKCFWIALQMYTGGILFNKLTLIYLYKRICSRAPTLSRLDRMLSILAYTCMVFSVYSVVLNCFYCTPIKAYWTPMPFPNLPEYCPSYVPKLSVYSWQGFNMASDIVIMVVPYFLLSQASFAHRSQLYALYGLFALGALVIVSSLIKVIGIAKTFEPETLVLWSFIEATASFIVACLPSLPPLIWTRRRGRTAEGASNPIHLSSAVSNRSRKFDEIQKDSEFSIIAHAATIDNGDIEGSAGVQTLIVAERVDRI